MKWLLYVEICHTKTNEYYFIFQLESVGFDKESPVGKQDKIKGDGNDVLKIRG